MSEQDRIDLQKLSQRELLIVTYQKVTELGEKVERLAQEQSKHEVRISLMEQKVMMWGALFGAISGAVVTIIVALIK